MIKMKNNLFIASALLSLLLGATACGQRPFMASMNAGLPVQAIKLDLTPVSQSDIYQATLISRYSVSLQPQVSGQIANIYVKAGDRVSSGQLLMVIDKRKQEAALNSSRASAAALKADISNAKNTLYNYQVQREALESSLEFNQKQYNRYQALYAKKSVSQQDLEKYTDSLNKAKSDLKANAAQIQAQESAIETAKSNHEKALYSIKEQEAQLQYYKIIAPYSGIIGDIPVKIGSYVTGTTQLLSITENNPLEINIGLPVEKVFDIRKGLAIEILDDDGNKIGNSVISFVSPRVDTNTQTILVKAILKNGTGIFKADQSVKARVIYKKAPGIMIPTSAVNHFEDQDFAYVINQKGKMFFVKQQSIKLGNIQNNKYTIISGLKKGDQIVSQGIQKLIDGTPVTIMPEGK